MDLQRTLLIGALAIVGVFTLRQWNEDYNQVRPTSDTVVSTVTSTHSGSDIPTINREPLIGNGISEPSTDLISVKTDTLDVQIDPAGGDIVGLALPEYPSWLPKEGEKAQPFQLMVNNPGCSGEQTCVYTAQSALVKADGPNSNNQRAVYRVDQKAY